jgi:hypothetical protein
MLKIDDCKYGTRGGTHTSHCRHPDILADSDYTQGKNEDGPFVDFLIAEDGTCLCFACPLKPEYDFKEGIRKATETLESINDLIEKEK